MDEGRSGRGRPPSAFIAEELAGSVARGIGEDVAQFVEDRPATEIGTDSALKLKNVSLH